MDGRRRFRLPVDGAGGLGRRRGARWAGVDKDLQRALGERSGRGRSLSRTQRRVRKSKRRPWAEETGEGGWTYGESEPFRFVASALKLLADVPQNLPRRLPAVAQARRRLLALRERRRDRPAWLVVLGREDLFSEQGWSTSNGAFRTRGRSLERQLGAGRRERSGRGSRAASGGRIDVDGEETVSGLEGFWRRKGWGGRGARASSQRVRSKTRRTTECRKTVKLTTGIAETSVVLEVVKEKRGGGRKHGLGCCG